MTAAQGDTRTLNNQVEIPVLGLGTWQARGRQCVQAVSFALNHGYALIDTAQVYGNESEVGEGWKSSGKTRDQVFLTTKIQNDNQGAESTRKSVEKSLRKLQTDYIDLLLIHWPDVHHFERTQETWQTLVELQASGVTRSIGVSNFTIALMERLLAESDVVPAVNQVEFHPFLYQKELLTYCNERKIQIEAYSPVARAKFFDHTKIAAIARKYQRTPAQIMLAWGVQHGLVVIPKSTHEDRIQENADIFFELEDTDMAELDQLDKNVRLVGGPPF